jgi:hypothetical protein
VRIQSLEAPPSRRLRGVFRAIPIHALVRRGPARTAGIAGAAIIGGVALVLALWAHAPQTEVAVSEALETEFADLQDVARADRTRPTVERAKRLPVRDTQSEASAPNEDRWAEGDQAPSDEAARELAELLAPDRGEAAPEANPVAATLPIRPDNTLTSAIPAGETPDTAQVAIAESQAEIAELEDRMARGGGGAFALASAGGEAGPTAPEEANGLARQGIVTSFVNLRAGPDNDATILQVVPEGAMVAVLDHCPNWCAVDHEGVRGFIYGQYIDRDEATAASETDGLD